jgi:hypothetical protein
MPKYRVFLLSLFLVSYTQGIFPYYMIYSIYLTAVGLTPGGSSTSHIYTQTVYHSGNELRGAEPFLRKLLVLKLVKKLSRIMWKPKVHYRDHKSLPLVPISNQMSSVPNIPSYFPKIHFNIIQSMPRSSKLYLSVRFTHQNPAYISLLSCSLPLYNH